MSNKFLERVFQILTAVFVGIAVYFVWIKDYETLFVIAVLAICFYFLSMRFQIKERIEQRKIEEEERELAELEFNRNILRENSEMFEIGTKETDNRAEENYIER